MTHHLHIALNVADLERSTEFYRRVFDLAPDKQTDSYVRFTVADPALVLSLNVEEAPSADSRVAHFGLRLDSASVLEAARQRLQRAGLVQREERQIHCCHAVQNKVWVEDPDGNEWELYEMVQDLQPGEPVPEKASRGCCS